MRSLWPPPLLAVLLPTLLNAGCSIYQMTGDVMSDYAVDHLTPYLMSTGDLRMACEGGVSMGGFLMSFGRVTDQPHQAAVSTLVAAALCAQEEAWENELRHIRALKLGQVAEAQDARIAEQRAHARAASRFWGAYQGLVAHYGEPSDKCPKLDNKIDETLWLFGLTAAVQAVQHDRASSGAVGVPMDAPRKAARGIRCLNNEQWWGVPMALQAAVWSIIPGAAPSGEDPWKRLPEATSLGDSAGMRAARAMEAQAASSAGKPATLKTSITALAASVKAKKSPEAFLLLDQIAIKQAEALSDRLWTEAKGHRTPTGGLGTFWEEEKPEEEDDLLEDLDEEPQEKASPKETP